MDQRVIVRFAQYEDIPRIMDFLAKEWDYDHILGHDRELFEWQYVEGTEVHFVIAEDSITQKMYGILGFNLLNHSEVPDISSGMKRALENPTYLCLGEALTRYLNGNFSFRYNVAPGVRERYAKVLRKINDNIIGTMNQYIRIHPNKENFVIAKVEKMLRSVAKGEKTLQIVEDPDELHAFLDEDVLKNSSPYQDIRFIKHRFFEHPIFQYKAWWITPFERGALLVGREVEHDGAKVLRLIDFVGDHIALCGIDRALDELMLENDYEYIDFFCYGIEEEILEQAGFFRHDWDTGNIFPDFFEPFIQENGNIYFFTKNKNEVVAFKAFGDQDRPRLWNK